MYSPPPITHAFSVCVRRSDELLNETADETLECLSAAELRRPVLCACRVCAASVSLNAASPGAVCLRVSLCLRRAAWVLVLDGSQSEAQLPCVLAPSTVLTLSCGSLSLLLLRVECEVWRAPRACELMLACHALTARARVSSVDVKPACRVRVCALHCHVKVRH